MGIKSLVPVIIKFSDGKAVGTYQFKYFSGMRIAVDASLLIYQSIIAMRSNGKDMKNNKGGLTSHLYGLFYKILTFLENNIEPVIVFDGRAPDIKNKTIDKRRQRKEQAKKKLEELSDSEDEEYIKNFKQTVNITAEDIKEAQILLDLMGIPYIIAPGEADVVCSWLAARYDETGQRYVKGVCSDDSDMLALGAPYLFKDMLKFMNKNKNVTVVSLNKTLKSLDLSMSQFTDFCVLLGCDYCDNLKGIGPKNAYKLIKQYGTLEKVIEHVNNSKNDSDDSDSIELSKNDLCMIEAAKYFKTAMSDLDQSKSFIITDDQLKLRQFQYEELMDFMCVKHNFDIIRITNGITRMKKYYKIMNVTRSNTKKYHKIIQPRSENYNLDAVLGNVDFVESDSSDSDNQDLDSISEPVKTKDTKIMPDLIRKKNI
ncbi:endonuclease of the XPG family [Cotonvirus japonicus]|uniref:Endonuclease of the XPG family n=1 Tax=Cotonvirus japonicus TaxID=2811091 RepID=A0ABM7NSP6_9VIRU|nr:endonuclease of the XPG family [Cotonvirus japonicus]BCS83169.1 endonuclease of the XPG family [Cotonvirus japonicus]